MEKREGSRGPEVADAGAPSQARGLQTCQELSVPTPDTRQGPGGLQLQAVQLGEDRPAPGGEGEGQLGELGPDHGPEVQQWGDECQEVPLGRQQCGG